MLFVSVDDALASLDDGLAGSRGRADETRASRTVSSVVESTMLMLMMVRGGGSPLVHGRFTTTLPQDLPLSSKHVVLVSSLLLPPLGQKKKKKKKRKGRKKEREKGLGSIMNDRRAFVDTSRRP